MTERSHLRWMRAGVGLFIGVAVLVALVLRATVAFGSSLVFIRDGNVWIATPDGATQRQVTTNGTPGAPYYSPSQADDGTIVAGGGYYLWRMTQAGVLLGSPIPTLLSDKPPNMYAAGPFNPRVSPDGTLVAYWIGLLAGSYDPGCDCYLTSPMESVVYTRTNGNGPIGFSRFWRTPSWIDSSHALVFAPDNRQTPSWRGRSHGARFRARVVQRRRRRFRWLLAEPR